MQPNMQKYPLTEEQMDALLDRARMGVISTIGEDGYPYGTPVNFVVMDGRIFFHGRKVGEKGTSPSSSAERSRSSMTTT